MKKIKDGICLCFNPIAHMVFPALLDEVQAAKKNKNCGDQQACLLLLETKKQELNSMSSQTFKERLSIFQLKTEIKLLSTIFPL